MLAFGPPISPAISPNGVYIDNVYPCFLHDMIRNPRTRRFLSILLVILGLVLMLFAPENIWIGAILFALGLGLEAAGFMLSRRR